MHPSPSLKNTRLRPKPSELEFEPQALVITEYDRAKIHLPQEIPGYDCDENSREYDTVRARHRIALP